MYDLNLPALEHVDVDRQLVDQALEERAVVTEAVDEHEALRIEIDLVGLRGDVVLRLVEAFAVREHLLAAGAEVADRSGDLLQLGDAAARHVTEIEHQRFDALVGLRGLDGIDEIAHQRFSALLAVQLRNRAIEWIAGKLLDERALRRDHQRGLVRHDRNARRQRRGEAEEQHQQHDQVHHLAQRVERAPDEAEER